MKKWKRLRVDSFPPIAERVARSCAYLLFSGGAVWSVAGQLPKSLDAITEPWHLSVFSLFLGFSIIASYATLRGRYKTEYSVIPWTVGAITLYEVGMIYAVAVGESPGSGLAVFLIGGLIMCLLARFISLHQLVIAPERIDRLKAELEEHQRERQEVEDG